MNYPEKITPSKDMPECYVSKKDLARQLNIPQSQVADMARKYIKSSSIKVDGVTVYSVRSAERWVKEAKEREDFYQGRSSN